VVRVHLVGRVAVEVDGAPVALPPGRATELLAWLAAHPGLHPRSRVAPIFWPDVTDATSRASLRTALWALRKALGPAGERVLALDRRTVGLEGDDLWVDVRDPEADATGDLLPGIEAEWADEVRADHRRALVARLSQQGDLEATRRLAMLDPFSEEYHRLLLRRLVDAGEQATALREHDAFRRRLWDELRLRPSAATRDFVQQLSSTSPAEAEATAFPPRLARVECDVFVGRDDEYRRLRETWQAVQRGAGPQVVLACGEAGIGKTCLLTRFAGDVHADGGTVLFGEAAEDELLPAEPFLEALGEHHSLTPPELVEIVRRRIEDIASRGPVLLVLDDFHWADSVSFAVLRRLARSQAAERLAVLVSFRPEEAARARFAALEADLARTEQLVRIDLGPLSPVSTGVLLGRLDPDGRLSARAERIHEETGGNPLFVRELGRYLLDSPNRPSVPDTVRNLVAARLHRLAAATLETVSAAAVLGLRAELGVLRHVLRPDLDVLEALDEAAGAGLIDEDGAGVHVFRHSLVRTAVYESMSKSRRAELHRRAADAIRSVHGDQGRHLCDIAEHRCAAVPADSATAAVADARRAGEWAVDNHAYDRAVVVLTKALPFAADPTTRSELNVRRAVAYQRLSHAIFDG
jgi:DNA-binding SARP family transcriptional activator